MIPERMLSSIPVVVGGLLGPYLSSTHALGVHRSSIELSADIKLGVLIGGCRYNKGLTIGVCIRAPDVWKLTYRWIQPDIDRGSCVTQDEQRPRMKGDALLPTMMIHRLVVIIIFVFFSLLVVRFCHSEICADSLGKLGPLRGRSLADSRSRAKSGLPKRRPPALVPGPTVVNPELT